MEGQSNISKMGVGGVQPDGDRSLLSDSVKD